jgi:hypothetical protein
MDMETKQNELMKEIVPVESSSNGVTEPVSGPVAPQQEAGPIDKMVSDEKLVKIYDDVLKNVSSDREEISEILSKFLDMVINDGDASAASKEAVVNLIKAKSDTNEQIIKIADLMTRLKMKERNTFNPAIHAHQNNIYNLGNSKIEEETNILLEEIEKASTRGRRK